MSNKRQSSYKHIILLLPTASTKRPPLVYRRQVPYECLCRSARTNQVLVRTKRSRLSSSKLIRFFIWTFQLDLCAVTTTANYACNAVHELRATKRIPAAEF